MISSESIPDAEIVQDLPDPVPGDGTLGLMADFSPADLPDDSMKRLYKWWRDHGSEDALPLRADFHPRLLPSAALPWVGMIDVLRNPLRLRNRLIGTGIVQTVGHDGTGHFIPAPKGEAAIFRTPIHRLCWMAMTARPYLVCGVRATWTVNDYRSYDVLGLPLALAKENRGVTDILLLKYRFS